MSEKHDIQSKNKSVKYQVKINDIIRYMEANNLAPMKDKIIYYASYEGLNCCTNKNSQNVDILNNSGNIGGHVRKVRNIK